LVPRPKEKPETSVAPRLQASIGDQQPEGVLKPRRETTAAASPKQKAREEVMAPGEPEESVQTPIPTSNRLFTPLVPGPKEKAETFIAPQLPANAGDQHQEGALKSRREIAMRAPPKQKADAPAEEIVPGAAVARQDSSKLVASTTSPSTSAADRKVKLGPLRPPGRPEPDEIQIHIGRIEVVAVPPAPALPASRKPQHGGPSLDEYLRRRDRRAV
jgi:hypothetical protein